MTADRADAGRDPSASIMPFAVYARLRHPCPYVLRLARGDERLVVFGMHHGADPADPAQAELEATFRELAPRAALHEGTTARFEDDRETAIRKHCEAGLIRYLAGLAGIPVASMDLPLDVEVAYWARRLGPGDALVFFVTRQLASFNRKSAKMDFDGYFAEFFADIEGPLGVGRLDWARVHEEYQRVFGERLEPRRVTGEMTDPLRTERLTQRIATGSNRLRDKHMLRVLVAAAAAERRVIAAVGVTHAVMLEPALWAAGFVEHRSPSLG